jgi:hypothetical protein
MREAHRGMNISEAEFVAAVDDILAALQRHGIDQSTQKDILAIGVLAEERDRARLRRAPTCG